jgi:hypothetical protein
LTGKEIVNKYLEGLSLLATSAWVGGMWVIGYVAAPVLFQTLADKGMAGLLAGKLFAATSYIGVVCASYLLLYEYAKYGRQVARRSVFWIIAIMLLFTLLGQYGLQPLLAELKLQAQPLYVMESPYAERFRLLHGVASIIFLLQSLLGASLLLKSYIKT